MYLSFFGLKIRPFQINTNPDFFWLGEKQKEALTIFKYGLSKMPGLLLLTGDAGTGKTTLINLFLESLGDQYLVVKIPDPDLEDIDFINYIADALDFKTNFSSKESFYEHFRHFLQTSFSLNQKVLLVIDECQRLSSQLLEEIIKLASIEKDGTKLLKVLLIGQNEFDTVLRKNTSRELHQLIAINYAIAPLEVNETGELIRHRLKTAGARRDIFSPDAISTVYELSSGIPLRINIICDHALLLGFGKGSKTINGELIRQCGEDLRPHDSFYQMPTVAVTAKAGKAPIKIGNKPTSARAKVSGHRRGTTFGMVVLVILPVFLIAFLINPAKLVNITDRMATPTQPPPSAPAGPQTTSQTPPNITPSPPIPTPKERKSDPPPVPEPAEENSPPAVEQLAKDTPKDDPKDALLQATSKPIPLTTVENTVIESEAAPENSEKIDASARSTQEKAPTGEEQDVALEKEVPPPAIALKEKAIAIPTEPSTVQVFEEEPMASKELLGKETAAEEEKPTAQKNIQETPNDAPEDMSKPKEAAETEDLSSQIQENTDPGAVIDYILKKRSN